MAVEANEKGTDFGGRQLAIGANVAVATLLVVAIVVVLQWGGYRFAGKSDWTQSGVNSLSEGTRSLLGGLDQNVRITSAYFQTDLEAESQAKFRQAVADLIDLYQIENRSKVEIDSFNPLQDHAKREELLERLSELPKFKAESAQHREMLETFHNKLLPEVNELLASELELIGGQGQSLGGQGGSIMEQIRSLLQLKQRELSAFGNQIDSALQGDIPRYSSAVSLLSQLYSNLTSAMGNIADAGREVVSRNPNLPPAQAEYLEGARERYQPLIDRLEEQTTKSRGLPRLELEDVVRGLTPDANAIIVQTDREAKVLGFNEVWPPLDPSMGGRSVAFKDRAFGGEQKISSAILQLTSPSKTAVVFVRYGGQPLFVGGFMPGQPPAPYARIKMHLEDLNFEVHEWDLSAGTDPPEMDPAPARIIYVLFKPSSPPPDPMRRQQQPTFGPNEREAVIKAIEESGRALFLAGWHAGPFGGMPATYEYGQYLNETWGIEVNTGLLLLQAVPIGPNQFRFGRAPMLVTDPQYGDQALVQRLGVLRAIFPWVCPLELAETPPEGVELQELVRCDRRDGLWGATSVQAYVEQTRNEFVAKAEGDPVGPFTLAATAAQGDDKLVVVSSREFFADDTAFAVEATLTSRGLRLHSRNPGNLTLLVNSLHWLNDNEEIMNLGRPLDVAMLEIAPGPTLTFLGFLTWGIWPALAIVCGGAVWYVRRR